MGSERKPLQKGYQSPCTNRSVHARTTRPHRSLCLHKSVRGTTFCKRTHTLMHKHNCERAQATALAHPARVLLRFKVSRRLDTARNQVGFWVRGRVYVGIVKRILTHWCRWKRCVADRVADRSEPVHEQVWYVLRTSMCMCSKLLTHRIFSYV